MKKGSWILCPFICVLAYLLFGCNSYVKPVDNNIIKKIAPFVEIGITRKVDVVRNTDFEYYWYQEYTTTNSTICIFRHYSPEYHATYDLVLIFDENGLLKKKSLVKPW